MQQSQGFSEDRLQFLDYWRVIKTRKAVVVAIFLLVVLVSATITFLQPKIYASGARIKVEQEKPTVDVFQAQFVPSYDPYFLQTMYEIIQSQKILHPVIQKSDLMKVWAERGRPLALPSMDLAFNRLKGQIAVRRFRDTSLIEIIVYDEDPQLAAYLANTIAEVFEKERLEEKRRQVLKGLEKLKDEVTLQLQRFQVAQTKVERLRRELDVPVVGAGGGSVKLTDQTLQALETQLTAAKVEVGVKDVRLKELKRLTPLQLRNAIATIISDPNVQSLLQSLTDSETRLESLKEDFGPEHPNVRSAIATHDKLQEQLDARLEGVMRGFEVDYQMAQARVVELQRQLDEAKSISVNMDGEKFTPFRNAVREEEMETRLYESLKSRLQQVSIELEVPRSPIELIDHAEPGRAPVRPNIWMNITIGAFVGLIMGVILTFFLEFLDTSIKKMEDIERYLSLPVLGVVAREGELIVRGSASPQHVESYRMLRTNIEFARGADAPKSLAVLSAGAGEGKSFTITNIACVYAQHGSRVLIVDSDLRRPNIHKNLGLANAIGLTDYLGGTKPVDDIIQPTAIPNLFAITAGGGGQTKSALPLLTSHRMEELIAHVAKQFDIVLYDTPPVLAVSDAAVVANEVGHSILVVQHRRYPRAMSIRAKHAIENAGGRLLGVVVNNVNIGQDESYYYYHDHYDRYLQPKEAGPAPTPAAPTPKPAAGDEIELQGKY
ncbi:MAG: polysaccharide biosynthesis tyrosine autokinase [Verrucomicrobiota bacterium]